MNTFGQKIRELRNEKGISLRRFATKVGVSSAYICIIEKGKIIPSEEKIVLLAKELGHDKDELLSLAGKISSDLSKIILTHPKEYVDLIRTISMTLNLKQIDKLTNSLRSKIS